MDRIKGGDKTTHKPILIAALENVTGDPSGRGWEGNCILTNEFHVLHYSPTSTRARKPSRPLVVDLLPTRYGFDPRSFLVGFVVEQAVF
jgi:hypothetical protein